MEDPFTVTLSLDDATRILLLAKRGMREVEAEKDPILEPVTRPAFDRFCGQILRASLRWPEQLESAGLGVASPSEPPPPPIPESAP